MPWSAHHGTATASGTRWTERGDNGTLFPALVVRGELQNTGTGCYSVWVQWTHDLAPAPPHKQATRCGPGAAPVAYRLPSYSLTTTGSLFVCKGDKNTTDCGPHESLTSWPSGTSRSRTSQHASTATRTPGRSTDAGASAPPSRRPPLWSR